jgi:tRNA uridine 5-carbamoylmethylation protein Kti12
VLDSLNYIKGFRYELHCISKAAGERHAVVWVLNETAAAMEWNRQPGTENDKESLSSSIDEQKRHELILRYEPPDARNRWDSPLYRVDMEASSSAAAAAQAVEQSVYNMHSLSDAIGQQTDLNVVVDTTVRRKTSTFRRRVKENRPVPLLVPTEAHVCQVAGTTRVEKVESSSTPLVSSSPYPDKKSQSSELGGAMVQRRLEQRIDEMLDSFLRDVKPLSEGMSTRQHVATDANTLQTLDATTQRICSALLAAQQTSANTGSSSIHTSTIQFTVTLADGTRRPLHLQCNSKWTMPQLQSLRQQYVQWIRSHPLPNNTDMAQSFVEFLEAQQPQ